MEKIKNGNKDCKEERDNGISN